MALRASAAFLRALLRSIYAGAQAASPPVTLAEALEGALTASVKETDTGKVLVAAGANGTTATYQIPGGGFALGAVDIAEAVESLLRRYELAAGLAEEGATDLELRDAVLASTNGSRRPGVSFEHFRP